MKNILHFCILATIFFGFQPNQTSAAENPENLREVRGGNTNYSFDQSSGILTLNLRTTGKSEMVFVSVMKTFGSTGMTGADMYTNRLTVVGGSDTFKLDISDLIPGTYTLTIHSQSIDIEDLLKIL